MDFAVIPFIVTPYIGTIPSMYIVERNMGWADKLNHPTYAPPKWIFAPIWGTLYAAMGTASYLVWRDAVSEHDANLALAVYGFQLALNWSWVPVFFGAHKIKASVAVILATLGGAVACAALFRPISTMASNLMLPYVAWLTYASAVNLGTALLN